MRRDIRHALRRSIALVLIVFMAAGCTKAVEIPRDQLSDAPEVHPGYRIEMIDGDHYLAKSFSITDSTLVIEKLNSADSRHRETTVPISLSMTDVESVSKLETRAGLSFALVAVFGVIIIALMNPPNFPASD